MSTPAQDTLIVCVSDVARLAGLPIPLEENDRWLVEQIVRGAQTDLEAYLGRPVTPRQVTETGVLPGMYGFELAQHPVIEVLSTTPETWPDTGAPTGRYTIVYRAGLDGRSDPELEPLRRFVTMHSLYGPDMKRLRERLVGPDPRPVSSLAVEGQSVSYEASRRTAPLEVGRLPTFSSCDRWRVARRRVAQGPSSASVWRREEY